MGNTLSIDLASRRYRDFGMALLKEGETVPIFISAADLALEDPPKPAEFAASLEALCHEQEVTNLLLDGSQGWRHPNSPIDHMRLCERVLNTPGKTGLPGQAKPGTYLNYIQFSIDVFQQFRMKHGWNLLTSDWAGKGSQRWLVEVFPSSAWSLLGLDRLPSKAKVGKKIETWRRELSRVTGYQLPEDLTHDELQAAVVLPMGHALNTRSEDLIILAGVDPIIERDTVYEGLIACPRLAIS